jgi:hypothetical protein
MNLDFLDFFKTINKQGLLIVSVIFIFLATLTFLTVRFKPRLLWSSIFLFSILTLFYFFKEIFIYKIVPFMVFPSVLIGGIVGLFTYPEPFDEIWDVKFATNKGTKILRNIKRGVLIFGAAGSGKTESPIYVLLRHLSAKLFTGIIYDYKDGELTEMCIPLFGERLKIISIHKPFINNRINIFSEKYINDEKDINEVVNVLIKNLGAQKDSTDFFEENATALFTAVVLKFHLDHRQYCTLPHIISFLLAMDFSETTGEKDYLGKEAIESFGKLKKFLISNPRVAMQASPFIMGLASERQTAAVLSTLANSLRKVAFPEAFWTLSGDTVDLDVNNPTNNSVLCILNEPKNDLFLTPILATIIHTATKQMMVRDRLPSFLLLDEAPTIKLQNMAKLPATMRSFGVAIIFCAQDLIQGTVKYGRDRFKEITANLSTKFFGKANDPDTAKFYEGYFDLIEQDQRSVTSKGGGNLFNTISGSTLSKREVSKVRAFEFTKLKAGDFAFLSDGTNEMIKFKRLPIAREHLDTSKNLTDERYLQNFNKIISDVRYLVKSLI